MTFRYQFVIVVQSVIGLIIWIDCLRRCLFCVNENEKKKRFTKLISYMNEQLCGILEAHFHGFVDHIHGQLYTLDIVILCREDSISERQEKLVKIPNYLHNSL